MNIINSEIHDINIENLDLSKVNLANKVIKYIEPILDEFQLSKLDELKSLKEDLNNKNKLINTKKSNLNKILLVYRKNKKIKKLLERLSKIISTGLVSNNYRHEIIVLLKVIDTLSNDKLEYHLAKTLKTINKNFSTSLL